MLLRPGQALNAGPDRRETRSYLSGEVSFTANDRVTGTPWNVLFMLTPMGKYSNSRAATNILSPNLYANLYVIFSLYFNKNFIRKSVSVLVYC